MQQAAACVSPTTKQLVGFVTPADVDVAQLREHLVVSCDVFVVQDLLFAVHGFPLPANGKVDAKALLSPMPSTAATSVETSSSLTKSLAWRSLVEGFAAVFAQPTSQINAASSFSALGGNSLAAVKLMSRLRHEDFRLPRPKIFELDTVAAMAGFLIQSQSSKEEEEEGDSSSAPLTTHQMELLRQTQAHPDANYIFYSLTRRTTSGDKPAPTPTCLRRDWRSCSRAMISTERSWTSPPAYKRSVIVPRINGQNFLPIMWNKSSSYPPASAMLSGLDCVRKSVLRRQTCPSSGFSMSLERSRI